MTCSATIVTTIDMFDRFKIVDLYNLCKPSNLLTEDVFEKQVRGEDISSEPADVQAAAIEAELKLCTACGDADSYIELSFITGRITIPLSPWPEAVVNHGCDLANFYLYDAGSTENDATRKIKYDAAMDFFNKIANGDLKFDIDDSQINKPVPWFKSNKRKFTVGETVTYGS